MSATVTKYHDIVTTFPEAVCRSFKIDLDDSYPTNGEAIDLSSYFPGGIKSVQVGGRAGYVFEVVESGSNTFASGKFLLKAMYADYDAVADGALIEVANEDDLSSVTDVLVTVWGSEVS